MAQDLNPPTILMAWVVGTVLALCGALAYSGVATLVPRSGGEYRYLSTLWHPALGYVAGWASIVLGFSGPIAIDALAAGAFAQTLLPDLNGELFAVVVVVAITALHAVSMHVSKLGQNVLVIIKILLVLGFVAAGMALGSWEWPTWQAPRAEPGFSWAPFMGSLFYIAFAFSGWNAAVYAAEEFQKPKVDVPRAMLLGVALVGAFYLAVNWVFVANLTPESAAVVMRYEEQHVTLAHAIVQHLLGDAAAKVASFIMLVAFLSAASGMMFTGPRVYASMAGDGYLPKFLRIAEGRPPTAAVLLQGGLALVLMFLEPLQHIMHDVSAVLVLLSALTVLGLFRVRKGHRLGPPPARSHLAAALVYAGLALWMLYFGFRAKTHLLRWILVVVGVALASYWFTRLKKRLGRAS
jgi:APA family basic amino acid/polyamine antiporter